MLNNKKLNKKLHIALLIVAILLGLWWLSTLINSTAPAPEANIDAAAGNISTQTTKAALTVDLVRPARNTMTNTIAANGSIAPWQEAVIGSESNGLMLAQVLVNVGDNVKRGQLLAEFSTAAIATDIAQAQANLAEAKANALEAEGNASRARSIQETGALSTQQIEQLIALEATSKARVAAAAATLQSQQIKLKQTKVIAPDSGIISGRAATVGAVVSPGQELFKLIRQGRLEWRAELTSSDIGQIKNGMQANLTLPDGSTITGKVRTASPMVDMQTRNAIVFVDIASNQAKAGMFARGTFDIGTKDVLTLPATAVVMKDGFAYVMEVAADGRVKQLKIQTGERAGTNVEIIGADLNSDFVASGGAFLADGDMVSITGKTMPSAKPIKQAK
jgi:HlyD family secretion protein